jgi:hypothetical protein
LKQCSKCKEVKVTSDFVKNKSSKDGLTSACKPCRNASQRLNWSRDPERHRNYGKKYVETNRERVYKRRSAHQKSHREVWNQRAKQWRDANPDRVKCYLNRYKPKMKETKALRRAAEINATPAWLTKEQRHEIKTMYKTATHMSEFHEVEFHVDHIEPLRGKASCGLHVPWNLQILTKVENLRKSNKLNQST